MPETMTRFTGLQTWVKLYEYQDVPWNSVYEKEAGLEPFFSSTNFDNPTVQKEVAELLSTALKSSQGGVWMSHVCLYLTRLMDLRKDIDAKKVEEILKTDGENRFEFNDSGKKTWVRLKIYANRPWSRRFATECKEHSGSDDKAFPPGSRERIFAPKNLHTRDHTPREPPVGGGVRNEVWRDPPGASTSFSPFNPVALGGRPSVRRRADDPRIHSEITLAVSQCLSPASQGATLRAVCAHINSTMGLDRRVPEEELRKLLCFVPSVEIKDSGKQLWLRLTSYQAYPMCGQFEAELAEVSSVVRPSAVRESSMDPTEEHVDLAMQIIFFNAGITGGIMFSDVCKLYFEKTRLSLTSNELSQIREKIWNPANGLEVIPDFSTSDLKIQLKFG